MQFLTSWIGDVHAFVGVASSYATSNVAYRFSSKHESLASW